MNYLQLVNRTLLESGLDSAPLTSGNFAIPPDRMYDRLKHWVAEANRQMQRERQEYQTLVKEGVALVSPRFSFYDYNDIVPATLPQGDARSVDTNKLFTTAPAIFSTTTEGYSDITAVNNEVVSVDNPVNFALKIGEVINYPPPAPEAITRFKRWGTYNLTDQNATLDTLMTDVDTVHLTSMTFTVDSRNTADRRTIPYVPFDSSDFPEHGCWYGTPGEPRLFTKIPDGRLAFYPHPAYPIRIRFNYTKKIQELSAFDDIPTWLDEKWHDGIVYLAASYYGDYEDPKVSQRSYRRYWNAKQQMERELAPVPSFRPAQLWHY